VIGLGWETDRSQKSTQHKVHRQVLHSQLRFQYRSLITSNGSSKLLRILKSHAWPGNVRELQQVIKTTLLERGGKGSGVEYFVGRLNASVNANPEIRQNQVPRCGNIEL